MKKLKAFTGWVLFNASTGQIIGPDFKCALKPIAFPPWIAIQVRVTPVGKRKPRK